MTDLANIRTLALEVDTTAICDADKATRVMSGAIRCRSSNPRMCGPAFTVRCRGDLFGVARAIEQAAPGDVVIVDGGGGEIAFAGELFARAAQVRGLAGIIVDGGYRDLGYVASCDLPVFSRHVSPMAGTASRLGDLQIPIACGGVSVSPGDIVIADAEGIVAIDPDRVLRVLESACEIKATEARAVAMIDAGRTLVDCLNLGEHQELLAAGEASTLRFTV